MIGRTARCEGRRQAHDGYGHAALQHGGRSGPYATIDGTRYIRIMSADHILVLAVDGLRASAFGAYGNTSFPTPTLDHLAADSFLFDWCFAESTDLSWIYRSLWQSAHPLRSAAYHAEQTALARSFSDRGYATTLITDEPELKSVPGADLFDRLVEVTGAEPARAKEVSQTSLARLFAAACEAIKETEAAAVESPQLVWIHSRGMRGPWDAPLELQAALLDENDPAPYDCVEPPDFTIAETDDPDAAFVYGCAYAAQMMVLDVCLEALLSEVDECWPAGRWLLALLGTRGYPLGEHKQVGGVDKRLFVEQLHVPMLIQMPDGTGRLARSGQLTTHADLLPTLIAHIESDIPARQYDGMNLGPLLDDPSARWRDAVLSVGNDGGHAIRTNEWCLRIRSTAELSSDAASDDANSGRELYVRPDDRWEANDVAELCPDVVDMLSQVADQQGQQIREGRAISAQWLPEPEPESHA